MDIGYLFLVASITSAVSLIALSIIYIKNQKYKSKQECLKFWRYVEYSALAFFVFSLLSFIVLLYYFLIRDFNVEYVFLYSNTHLPLLYTISATWAGKEGSLLLWLLYLSLFILIFVVKSEKDEVTALATAISGIVAVFFNYLLLTSSNPFVRLKFYPPEGYGLNPLLRTPEMALHPPTIFLGYAGLTIPLALAIASTYYRKDWIKRGRSYLLVAWSFLGVGILLGAWWAYKTLGWGGFWGWDPVENSSLLPWLTSSALLHGVIAEERKKVFKAINYFLAIVSFDLVILATFITRSGIINSVHAFARSQEAYLYLALIFLVSIIGIIVAIARRDVLTDTKNASLREYLIQASILIFVFSTVTILIGTLTPLMSPYLSPFINKTLFTKFIITKKYYKSVEIKLGVILVILLGICVAAYGKSKMHIKLIKAVIVGIIAGIVTFALSKATIESIGFAIFFFTLTSIIESYYERKMNLRRLGALLAHIGLILLFIGVMGAWMYEASYVNVAMPSGGVAHTGKYTLKLNGFNEKVYGNEKMFIIANVSVYKNGKLIGIMHPKLVIYNLIRKDRIVASVDIISTPFYDMYIAMKGVDPNTGIAYFQFYIVPLVSFVWAGALMIISGGIIAVLYKRREE